MTAEQMLRHLRHANDVARATMVRGHHPFGALPVAADNESVLLVQGNVDTVNLARRQKTIQVFGPFAEVEAEISALHRDFWRAH